METKEKKLQIRTFNKRSFVAITMFLSGLCLPFSGLMNHRLQFESMTVERHFWMSVHNAAAILFAISAILHISYNWRVMTKYMKKAKEITISKEAITAFALVSILVGLFSLHAFHAG